VKNVSLPSIFLESLEGSQGFDREAFVNIHTRAAQITSVRLNPRKVSHLNNLPALSARPNSGVPWAECGYYLDSRPSFTFDPLFHAGCYYVQEASSMFLEFALRQVASITETLHVLDLSAAPGGKSTHLQSLISPTSLLVSNDVIRSRANVLKDNIIKWGCENVVVTNNDPRDFSGLPGFFDVMVVDAPCSGSGLFRREPEAMNEWSPANVMLCSQRQQRILADSMMALKENGILVYSTCSYSKEEDEEIIDWLITRMNFEPIELEIPSHWNIVHSSSEPGGHGYRFWPDKLKGEGFFIACLRKKNGDAHSWKVSKLPSMLSKNEMATIKPWINIEGKFFFKHESTVYAWPESLVNEMDAALKNLRVIYSGVRAGELMRDKLVPDHALALSNLVTAEVPRTELNYENAIKYLQRRDFEANASVKGWQLVNYEGHSLGWMNVLANRINNYYPKELRILKDN